MSRFQVFDTPIGGLKIIERSRLADERGFLSRMFCSDELHAAGWRKPIAQIHCHIPHFSPDAIDQLHLGMWWILKMHSADCAGNPGQGLIDLRDRLAPASRLQLIGAKHA